MTKNLTDSDISVHSNNKNDKSRSHDESIKQLKEAMRKYRDKFEHNDI